MTEDPLRYPTVLFDWGDTVLRDDPGMTAPMVEWETVEAIEGIADVLAHLHASGRRIVLATSADISDESQIRGALARVGLDKYLVRTIARMNTEMSCILELRGQLPPQIGHLMLCSLSTSLTWVYLPFHLGIGEIEPHFATASAGYDPRSAYWLFTELAKLADYGYTRCIDRITSTWRSFESETLSALPAVETRTAALGEEEACALLTEFDRGRAEAAIETLQRLLPEVKTRVFYEDF